MKPGKLTDGTYVIPSSVPQAPVTSGQHGN